MSPRHKGLVWGLAIGVPYGAFAGLYGFSSWADVVAGALVTGALFGGVGYVRGRRREKSLQVVLAELSRAGCVPIATARDEYVGSTSVRVCGLVTEVITADGSPDCLVEDTTGAIRLSMSTAFWKVHRSASLAALVVAIDGSVTATDGGMGVVSHRTLSPTNMTVLPVKNARNRRWVGLGI